MTTRSLSQSEVISKKLFRTSLSCLHTRTVVEIIKIDCNLSTSVSRSCSTKKPSLHPQSLLSSIDIERTTIDRTLKFLSSPHSAFISFNASFLCVVLTTKFRFHNSINTSYYRARVIECVRDG